MQRKNLWKSSRMKWRIKAEGEGCKEEAVELSNKK